jgi:hypothetical protein
VRTFIGASVGLSLGKIRETLHPPFALGREDIGLDTTPLLFSTGKLALAVRLVQPANCLARVNRLTRIAG